MRKLRCSILAFGWLVSFSDALSSLGETDRRARSEKTNSDKGSTIKIHQYTTSHVSVNYSEELIGASQLLDFLASVVAGPSYISFAKLPPNFSRDAACGRDSGDPWLGTWQKRDRWKHHKKRACVPISGQGSTAGGWPLRLLAKCVRFTFPLRIEQLLFSSDQ